MTSGAEASESRQLHPLAALLGGTLVIGSLDMAYAIAFWAMRGVAPIRIFQSVAAGLLGSDAARGGGMRTALLGAALHYFIAFSIVLVYWIASRALPLLIQRPVLCGAAYGLIVYGVMNYVVIPLSNARKGGGFLLSWFVCSLIVHAFLIGVPAALFARAARAR